MPVRQARATWSRISSAVRLRRNPIAAVAQNRHPAGQPDWEDRQRVVLPAGVAIATVSTGAPSAATYSVFTARSVREDSSRSGFRKPNRTERANGDVKIRIGGVFHPARGEVTPGHDALQGLTFAVRGTQRVELRDADDALLPMEETAAGQTRYVSIPWERLEFPAIAA